MKTAIAFSAVVLGLTLSQSFAQPPGPGGPGEKRWDISKVDTSKLPPVSTQQGVTFDKDIQPLFKASCVRCHSGDHARANFRLDSLDDALKGGRDGAMIKPGDSEHSLLVAAVAKIHPGAVPMPPPPRNRPNASGATNAPAGPPPPKPLTTDEVGLVRAWIDQGAK